MYFELNSKDSMIGKYAELFNIGAKEREENKHPVNVNEREV